MITQYCSIALSTQPEFQVGIDVDQPWIILIVKCHIMLYINQSSWGFITLFSGMYFSVTV